MAKKKYLIIIHILFFLPLFAFQVAHEADALKLNSLFSDHMVLQQKSNVTFWGTFRPSNEIIITSNWGETGKSSVDVNGNWNVSLKTPEAGGPYTIEVKSGSQKTIIKDVLVGEVWLASGQSNMEMTMLGWPPNDVINNAEEEIAKSTNFEIRMFNVAKELSLNALSDVKGSWKISGPEETQNFSATAYFFAKELSKRLQIPIGIIHSSWGGTPAESWTSQETINTLPELRKLKLALNNSSQYEAELNWFSHFEQIKMPIGDRQWDNLDLGDNMVSKTSHNDGEWEEIYLPGSYDKLVEGGEFNGAVWFRKNVFIDDITSDYTLTIGAIDDMDETYVNGHKIGGYTGMGYWNKRREYEIPKSILRKGNNLIAVKAIDAEGEGEVIGPLTLSNNSNTKISLSGDWKYSVIAEIHNKKLFLYNIDEVDFSSRVVTEELNPGVPTVLYNGMINPLVPYTIKGVIWYQGESNVGRAAQYKELFPAMINDWRRKWNYDFSFYYVQIAPFQYNLNSDALSDNSQDLREAQRHSLYLKNTGMAVTLDIGNFNNIHPSNKQEVGNRLARLALFHDYNFNLIPSGPIFKELKVDKEKLILKFYNPGSKLVAKGDLLGFEIAGLDKKYVYANARIIDNTVELFSDNIKKPVYARYAWRDKAVPTLFNSEGLPASSFKSED